MGSQKLAAQTDILNWYLGSESDSTQDRKDWLVYSKLCLLNFVCQAVSSCLGQTVVVVGQVV